MRSKESLFDSLMFACSGMWKSTSLHLFLRVCVCECVCMCVCVCACVCVLESCLLRRVLLLCVFRERCLVPTFLRVRGGALLRSVLCVYIPVKSSSLP